jgi:hypothetical protein
MGEKDDDGYRDRNIIGQANVYDIASSSQITFLFFFFFDSNLYTVILGAKDT